MVVATEEQSAITGLPGACQYGFVEGGRRSRPKDFEVGVQVNRAGGNIYEGQLEYSWLMLRYHQFSGADLAPYLPFIEQSVIFYDEHYRFRCKQLTGKELDENGKLVIYPANTLEAHWNARNPTSVIAGLRRVLGELINLPEKYSPAEKKKRWQDHTRYVCREMPTGNSEKFGGKYLKPSENHNHQSWHCPEMYPLFPYELNGIGQGDLDLMKRTSLATGSDRFTHHCLGTGQYPCGEARRCRPGTETEHRRRWTTGPTASQRSGPMTSTGRPTTTGAAAA